MRQTKAPRSSVEDFESDSPSFLNDVIPASFSAAATTGVAFIDDRLAIEETFGRNNQFGIAIADLIGDDPILGIFFLAEAITFESITATSISASTSDVKIRVIWNSFNTRTVLVTVDKLKVISQFGKTLWRINCRNHCRPIDAFQLLVKSVTEL